MAQLQKGTTYSAEDNTVTVANLNAHVDSAILLDGAVSAQTALGAAPASDDLVLLSDTDAATLKSATTTELLGTELAAWVGKGASGGTAALQINGVDKLSIDSAGDTSIAGNLNLLTEKEMRLQDAAGNEYVGVKAPATVDSSYTMTLPDEVGAAGSVLKTSDASGTLSWSPAGSILQVVYADVTANTFSTSSTSMAEITGFSATITPKSATSKILIQAMISFGGSSENYIAFGLKRDSTQIGSSSSATGDQRDSIIAAYSPYDYSSQSSWFQLQDEPATTSATEYKVTVSNRSGYSFYLNRPATVSPDEDYIIFQVSSLTLTEIAA